MDVGCGVFHSKSLRACMRAGKGLSDFVLTSGDLDLVTAGGYSPRSYTPRSRSGLFVVVYGPR